jgi:uncharacterized protein YbaP (TraB family)
MRLFLCAVLFISCAACSTLDKPFFWKIEKDGKESHVLGTMHAGIDIRELPIYVHENLDKSKVIFVEITRESELNNPYYERFNTYKDFFKKHEQIIYKNVETNNTIQKHFTDEQWRKILERVKPLGLDEKVVPYFTLPILNILLRQQRPTFVNFEQMHILETKMLDGEVESRGILAKKPVRRLDPLQRMKPHCYELRKISSILYQLDNNNYDYVRSLVEDVEAYKTGDAERLLKKEKAYDKELDKCLLDERNKHWLKVIDQHHKEEAPLFIAAGVRHFIGEGNVLDGLVQMGYKVTRYPLKD